MLTIRSNRLKIIINVWIWAFAPSRDAWNCSLVKVSIVLNPLKWCNNLWLVWIPDLSLDHMVFFGCLFFRCFRSFISIKLAVVILQFTKFPCSECADLIGPGNEVADEILNPSASCLLLSLAFLDVPSWMPIWMEPVWFGSSVFTIRGSCLSPPYPQPPHLGPSTHSKLTWGTFICLILRGLLQECAVALAVIVRSAGIVQLTPKSVWRR